MAPKIVPASDNVRGAIHSLRQDPAVQLRRAGRRAAFMADVADFIPAAPGGVQGAAAGQLWAQGSSATSPSATGGAPAMVPINATPTPSAKGEPKSKGQRKAKKGVALTEHEPTEHIEEKKCNGRCKTSLPMSMFFKDMNKCKVCYSKKRSFDTKTKTELSDEKLNDLRTNAPEKLEEAEKAHAAAWDSSMKLGNKLNFSVKTFIHSLEAKSGVRYLADCPMLWHGAYVEWAKSAAGGFLTDEECEGNWESWKSNPSHPRDNDGPRGYLQLAIPRHTKTISNFNELSQTKKLELTSKLSKKMTDAELAKKANEVGTGFDNMKWNMSNLTGSASGAIGTLKDAMDTDDVGMQDRY